MTNRQNWGSYGCKVLVCSKFEQKLGQNIDAEFKSLDLEAVIEIFSGWNFQIKSSKFSNPAGTFSSNSDFGKVSSLLLDKISDKAIEVL